MDNHPCVLDHYPIYRQPEYLLLRLEGRLFQRVAHAAGGFGHGRGKTVCCWTEYAPRRRWRLRAARRPGRADLLLVVGDPTTDTDDARRPSVRCAAATLRSRTADAPEGEDRSPTPAAGPQVLRKSYPFWARGPMPLAAGPFRLRGEAWTPRLGRKGMEEHSSSEKLKSVGGEVTEALRGSTLAGFGLVDERGPRRPPRGGVFGSGGRGPTGRRRGPPTIQISLIETRAMQLWWGATPAEES